MDAWCHAPGELVVALDHNGAGTAISFLTHAPIVGAFRRMDVGRPRRNAKSLFRALQKESITGVEIVESDRILILKLTGRLQLQAHLYGSRPNVILVNQSGEVVETFRKGASFDLPSPRVTQEPQSVSEFITRWGDGSEPPVRALQRMFIRFSREQAREAIRLADWSTQMDLPALFEAAHALHCQLLSDSASCYSYQDPSAVSLIPLTARSGEPVEISTDIDGAVRRCAQHSLSERAYRAQFGPIQKTLVRALDKAVRSAERMKVERSQPSRADEYERLGHILMASEPFPAGESHVELEDVFHPGRGIQIRLDPALNSLQNAERYYAKAGKARTSRAHLDSLIKQADAKVESLKTKLEELSNAKTYKALKAFQKVNHSPVRTGPGFRRYTLTPAYELWVGRNAKESEALTFRHARPFDLWFHARGVSGAHAVLRLPGRHAQPSRYLIEQAAAIAAWHSKARTSSFAPVIVTPRKYVRKVRGTPLGEVTVSREEVVMVEPALP